MANLTLRIEDSLLREARKVALENQTTVNKMVREFLAEATSQDEREKLRNRQLESLFEAFDDMRAEKPVPALNREELYDR